MLRFKKLYILFLSENKHIQTNSVTIRLRRENEINWMNWNRIFKEYFINSPIWKFNKKNWNDNKGMHIPFHYLLNGRNAYSFNKTKMKYQFNPYFEEKQIKSEWYNSKIKLYISFFCFFNSILIWNLVLYIREISQCH